MAISIEYQPVLSDVDSRPLKVSVGVQLLGASILVVALVVKIWLRVESTEYGYALASERQRMVVLDGEHRRLSFELSQLMQHDSLRAIAKQRLGMVATDESRVWKIKE